MELYILDSSLRRDTVVDRFESLVWTERFSDIGDFELTMHSTAANRKLFTAEMNLALNESNRVMTVKTIENKTDADGKATLTVKGVSLEAVLADRVARPSLNNTTTTPVWTITGTPTAICRKIFQDICVTGVLSPDDVIPGYVAGTMYTADTIAEPTTPITVDIDPKTVYDAIKEICDIYDFGFRLTRKVDTSQLYFNIYMGRDMTTKQTTYPAVVFSPELDNLQNTSELASTQAYKNVAYVLSPVGTFIVFPDVVDPDISGFERRVLMVDGKDITSTVPATALAQATQLGQAQLALNRQLRAFDGEINPNSAYKYGVDYQLGDMVEIRNQDAVSNDMQVTEQIFSSDSSGDRSYPTLSLNQFITPGSWLAWPIAQTWADLIPNMTLTWATAP